MSLAVLRVFTADGCSHCQALCADLRRRRVEFVEVNLSRQPEALDELRSLCWEHRLPVVVHRERVSIGFRGGSSTFAEVGLE
jgi:glutaredoxin